MNILQVMAINSCVDTNTRDCIKLFTQITYLSREIREAVEMSYRIMHSQFDSRFAMHVLEFTSKVVNATRLYYKNPPDAVLMQCNVYLMVVYRYRVRARNLK